MKISLPREIVFFITLLILSALITATELWVTQLFGPQTLSPFLSVLALAFIALRFDSRCVLLALLPLCVLSFGLIQDHSRYPLIRTLTVIVGGGLAAWASCQKTCLEHQIQEFEAVLRNLPLPWLLSDSRGKVILASTTLATMTGKSTDELVGVFLFSVLTPPAVNPQGQDPASLSLKSERVEIHPFLKNRSTKIFKASYLPLVIHQEHCLLTILKET